MDLFYCTNAINYTVATAGVLARRPRPAILVYERRRFAVRRITGVWQLPISANAGRALQAFASLRSFDTIYVPHHRVARRFEPLLAGAQRLAYLDDGLDTLRVVPRNFNVSRLRPDEVYCTFEDYPSLPAWLDRLRVERVCRLADVLRTARQPPVDLANWDHVFVESPGLDPPALCSALQLEPARVLVIRHPVPQKQGPLPEGCKAMSGSELDCEGSLLATSGKSVYCGETMVFWLLLHSGAASRHTLWLQMADSQWQGLTGLPPMTAVTLPGVGGRVARLGPS